MNILTAAMDSQMQALEQRLTDKFTKQKSSKREPTTIEKYFTDEPPVDWNEDTQPAESQVSQETKHKNKKGHVEVEAESQRPKKTRRQVKEQ